MPEDDLHILRLGYQDRANFLPLLYPLKAGWTRPESPWKLEMINAGPLELTDGLLSGRLDAAFVPPLAVQQDVEQLAPLGGWGLSCEGAVGTAILLAPRRLDLMHEADVAVTRQAYGSSADYLLQTLLKPYYDITLSVRPPGHPAYNPEGARLLYEDKAAAQARNKPAEWVAEDLGVAWFVLVGLPMVWELLAARRDLEERKPGAAAVLRTMVSRSLRVGQEQQASILAEASARLALPTADSKQLFSRQRYALADAEQKGIARFLDMAARAGVRLRT